MILTQNQDFEQGSGKATLYLSQLHDLALREGLSAQLCVGLVLPEAQVIGSHDEPIAINHLCKPDTGMSLCPSISTKCSSLLSASQVWCSFNVCGPICWP